MGHEAQRTAPHLSDQPDYKLVLVLNNALVLKALPQVLHAVSRLLPQSLNLLVNFPVTPNL